MSAEKISPKQEQFIENCTQFYYDESKYALKDDNEKWGAYPGQFKLQRLLQGHSSKPNLIEADVQKIKAKKIINLSDFSTDQISLENKKNEKYVDTLRIFFNCLIKLGFDMRYWDGEKSVKLESQETLKAFKEKIKCIHAVSTKKLKNKLAEEGICGDAVFNLDHFELHNIAKKPGFEAFGEWRKFDENPRENNFDILVYEKKSVEEKIAIEEWLLEKKDVTLFFRKDGESKNIVWKDAIIFLIQKLGPVITGISFHSLEISEDFELFYSIKKIKNLKIFIWEEVPPSTTQMASDNPSSIWETLENKTSFPDWELEVIDINTSNMSNKFFNSFTKNNTKLRTLRLKKCEYICDIHFQQFPLEELSLIEMKVIFKSKQNVLPNTLIKLTLKYNTFVPDADNSLSFELLKLREFICKYDSGEKHVESIINASPNLERLNVSCLSANKDLNIHIKLTKLKNIFVSSAMSSVEFKKAISHSSNIESIKYQHHEPHEDFVPENIQYPNLKIVTSRYEISRLKLELMSHHITTFTLEGTCNSKYLESIEEIITTADFTHITCIKLVRLNISGKMLALLLKKATHLKELNIIHCYYLTDFKFNINDHGETCKNIEVIEITDSKINQFELEQMINSTTALRTISMKIIKIYLSAVNKNKGINTLNLLQFENDCSDSSDTIVSMSNIKTLKVPNSVNGLKNMKKYLPFLPNLEQLIFISYDYNVMADAKDFPENLQLPNIKEIIVNGEITFTIQAIMVLLKAASNSLEAFFLPNKIQMNDSDIELLKGCNFPRLVCNSDYYISEATAFHIYMRYKYFASSYPPELRGGNSWMIRQFKTNKLPDWVKFDNVTHLHINYEDFTGHDLINLLKHFPNLISLSIVTPPNFKLPDDYSPSFFEKLEEFEIQQAENFNKLNIEEIIIISRANLKSLKIITSNNKNCHSNSERYMDFNEEDVFDKLETININGLLLGKCFIDDVLLRAKNLKSIILQNIQAYPGKPFVLTSKMSAIRYNHLESLKLDSVTFDPVVFRILVSGKKEKLKKLIIKNSNVRTALYNNLSINNITGEEKEICDIVFTHLEDFTLDDTQIDSQLVEQFLLSINHLKSQNFIFNINPNEFQHFEGCDFPNEDLFGSALQRVNTNNNRVDSVIISQQYLNFNALTNFLIQFPYTSTLALTECHLSHTLSSLLLNADIYSSDIVYQFLMSKKNAYLRKITLFGCEKIPQGLFTILLLICPNLERIELHNCTIENTISNEFEIFLNYLKHKNIKHDLRRIHLSNTILPKTIKQNIDSWGEFVDISYEDQNDKLKATSKQNSTLEDQNDKLKVTSKQNSTLIESFSEPRELKENKDGTPNVTMQAEELFTPSVFPSEYRLGVYTIDESNLDEPGANIRLIPMPVYVTDLESSYSNIKYVKSLSELKKIYEELSNSNKDYELCQTPFIITNEWKPLPSHYIYEEITTFYSDFKNNYQIEYSSMNNFYYIRSDEATFEISKIAYILKIDKKRNKSSISHFPDEIRDKIEQARSFKYKDPSEFIIKPKATPREIFQKRFQVKIGSCLIRTIALDLELKTLFHPTGLIKLFYSKSCYSKYDVRIPFNKLHTYVEINDGNDWSKVELGGYPAKIEITEINFQEDEQKKNRNKNTDIDGSTNELDSNFSQAENNNIKPRTKSEWLKNVVNPSQNSVVLLEEADDCLKIIAEIEKETQLPYFLIDSPDDLQWHIKGLQFEDNSNILKVKNNCTSLREFVEEYQKTQKGLLFINWNNFNDEEKASLHSIIDSNRTLEGDKFNKNIPIVSFYRKNENETELEDDFESRHDRRQIIHYIEFNQSTDPYCDLCHKIDFKNTTLLSEPIDCFESEDFQNIIFGHLKIKQNQFEFDFNSRTQKDQNVIPSLYLKNPPWHLREFQLFWQKAMQLKQFKLYNKVFKLSDDFQLYYDVGYDLNFKDIFTSFKDNEDSVTVPLNQNTFHKFFAHECSNGTQYYTQPGWLDQHKNLTIVLTQNLTFPQWCRLLKTAQQNKVNINLKLSPNTELPKELSELKIPVSSYQPPQVELNKVKDIETLKSKPYAFIQTKNENKKVVIEKLLKTFKNAIYIELDKSHNFGTLFYKNMAELTENGVITKYFESEVFKALQEGRDVIIDGALPQQLINALSEFLIAGKSTFIANGKPIELKGKLIFIGDNHVYFSQNIYTNNIQLQIKKDSESDEEEDHPVENTNKAPVVHESKDLSEQAYKNFETRRFNRIKKALKKNPIIFLKGKTGVGKSTYTLNEFEQDYFNRTGRKAKVYRGEDKLDDFGKHNKADTDAFLIIDEANQSTLRLSTLKGVKNPFKKHLLTELHYHESFDNKYIILIGNDKKYGGARLEEQQNFIDAYASVVEYEDPNHAYFYHKILKPKNIPENIANIILDVFDQINSIAEKNGYSTESGPFLSQRHLKIMAMMFNVFKEHHSNNNFDDNWRAVMSCLTVLGDRLNDTSYTQLITYLKEKYQYNHKESEAYKDQFIQQKIESNLKETNKSYAFMKVHYPFLFTLDAYLSMPDHEVCDFGILLEGESGVGKSKVAQKYMKLIKQDVVQFSWSKNFESDKAQLLNIFQSKKKVIIDEYNAGGVRYEKLINDLMISSPFKLIATQNSISKKGRRPLTPAQMARITPVKASQPKTDDLILMATHMAKKFIAKQSLLGNQYTYADTELTLLCKHFEKDKEKNNSLNLRDLKKYVESMIKKDDIYYKLSQKPKEDIASNKIINTNNQGETKIQNTGEANNNIETDNMIETEDNNETHEYESVSILNIFKSDDNYQEWSLGGEIYHDYPTIIKQLENYYLKEDDIQFENLVEDCYHQNIIEFDTFVQLSHLIADKQSPTITENDLQNSISQYHQNKGQWRKFWGSSTQTIKELESLLFISKKLNWKQIYQSDIELIIKERDRRKCATRFGNYKTNLISFFKPQHVIAYKLSQTELAIFTLKQKPKSKSQ